MTFLRKFNQLLQRLEWSLHNLFGKGHPPDAFGLCGVQHELNINVPNGSFLKLSVKDLIGDGFLWAVPKHRRTVERRLQRKFGHPEYVWKMLTPKTHLRVCHQCGHDHEVGVLCAHCYKKVNDETKLMQEKIQEHLGLQPIEQEVIVLYEGEKSEQPSEFLNGKRIIEMKKPRPMWFSKNLMQKTTQQPSATKEVKPTDLG